jgi:hypothetical protein
MRNGIIGKLPALAAQAGQLTENETLPAVGRMTSGLPGGPLLGAGVCIGVWAGIRLKAGDIQMLYKKINVELIVVADEAEAVVADLNGVLDRLEEKHTLFGGGIETVPVEHQGARKRSALAHTIAAGETVGGAVRAARDSVTIALRAVI